jgi:hypothetical protein
MTAFAEALITSTEVQVRIDARASSRAGNPTQISVAPGGMFDTAGEALASAVAISPTPSAWVTRGGTVFVLADPGSGEIIYEGTKNPTVLQRRGIDAVRRALGASFAHLAEPARESIIETDEPASEPASELADENLGSEEVPE